MTVEEKAEEYAYQYASKGSSKGQYEWNQHYHGFNSGFVEGYNMRDGEAYYAIEVLRDLVKHYEDHGQLLTWNVGEAIRALEDLPQPPKNN